MSLFFKLFHLFRKNSPHRDFLKHYVVIQQLATALFQNLRQLRKIQKELVARKIRIAEDAKSGTKTGGIGLQKTLFIEEAFIGKLKALAAEASSRLQAAEKSIHQTEPLSPLEQEELQRVIQFLEKVQVHLPDPEVLAAARTDAARLTLVEDVLRETTKLAQEYHEVEHYERSLARRIRENEISPLLKRVYLHPETREIIQNGRKTALILFKLTRQQLRELEQETAKINQARDPQYQIQWRQWWREPQIPERDSTTPLREPHINVTLRLFGGPKKEIHLLVA